MEIFELIKQDHRKVESLFSEIEEASSAKKLKQLFQQLYQELNLHSLTEELTLYPSMREYEETDVLIDEAEEEHVEVKIMLEEMQSLDPNSSEFQSRIAQLREAVLHHVGEEENEVFPAIQECFSEEELDDLAEEFKETKSRLEKEMSATKS